METQNVKYSDMVAALKKDGGQILESMTPLKADLLHMAVGEAGEGTELLECFLIPSYSGTTYDRVNAVEELGDLEFYVEGICQPLSIADTYTEIPEDSPVDTTLLQAAAQVAVKSGNLLDTVKKFVIYDKALDETAVRSCVFELQSAMAVLYRQTGITREEAFEANKVKLLTGEKARYKLGKYTDEQAQTRQDKEGAE